MSAFPLPRDATMVVPRDATSADWRDVAACRDMDVNVFFALDETSQRRALSVCERCPVRARCLDHAVAAREVYGVWGGVREQDRKRMLRRRAVA